MCATNNICYIRFIYIYNHIYHHYEVRLVPHCMCIGCISHKFIDECWMGVGGGRSPVRYLVEWTAPRKPSSRGKKTHFAAKPCWRNGMADNWPPKFYPTDVGTLAFPKPWSQPSQKGSEILKATCIFGFLLPLKTSGSRGPWIWQDAPTGDQLWKSLRSLEVKQAAVVTVLSLRYLHLCGQAPCQDCPS